MRMQNSSILMLKCQATTRLLSNQMTRSTRCLGLRLRRQVTSPDQPRLKRRQHAQRTVALQKCRRGERLGLTDRRGINTVTIMHIAGAKIVSARQRMASPRVAKMAMMALGQMGRRPTNRPMMKIKHSINADWKVVLKSGTRIR